MRFPIPAIWGTAATPIAGLQKIVESYGVGYSLEVLPSPDFTVVTFRGNYNVLLTETLANYKVILAILWNARLTTINSYTLLAGDQMAGLAWTGTAWITN